MDYEIGLGRSFYGREVNFSRTSKEIVGLEKYLGIMKTNADVPFMDADVKNRINFRRQIAVELHRNG